MAQFFFFTLCFLFSITSTEADKTLAGKLGGTVVLNPGDMTDRIKDIMWKHNNNIAVEWDGGSVTYYRLFKGHGELNTTTGELMIFNLTQEHSGSYRAQVNRVLLKTTELKVFSPVPKPTVSKQCDQERNFCILSCDGNTTGAGLVTHTWMSGDQEVGSTKDYNVSKDAKEPSFHCVMKNKVSSERSEEYPNPLISVPGNQKLWYLFFVAVLVLILVVVGFLIYRRKKGKTSWKPKNFPFVRMKPSVNGTAYNPAVTFTSPPPESCTAEPLDVQVHAAENEQAAAHQETHKVPETGPKQAEDQEAAEVVPTPPVTYTNSQDAEDQNGQTQGQTASSERDDEAETSVLSSEGRQSSSCDVPTATCSDTCSDPGKNQKEGGTTAEVQVQVHAPENEPPAETSEEPEDQNGQTQGQTASSERDDEAETSVMSSEDRQSSSCDVPTCSDTCSDPEMTTAMPSTEETAGLDSSLKEQTADQDQSLNVLSLM